MAIVVTKLNESLPVAAYVYKVTGLTSAGASQAVSTPTPPQTGSFPPLADWTPSTVLCFALGVTTSTNTCVWDGAAPTNAAGVITFNLSTGTGCTSCIVVLF